MNLMETHAECAVLDYENACSQVAKIFVKHYYDIDLPDKNVFWIGGKVGEILSVNDEFYGVDRMVQALKWKATWQQVIDYYYAETENDEKPKVSFENYVRYGRELK